METTSSVHTVIFIIMMFMGYAIAFSYLLISLAKKEIKFVRNDNERDLKYFKDYVERDFQRLRDENIELRRDLCKLAKKESSIS